MKTLLIIFLPCMFLANNVKNNTSKVLICQSQYSYAYHIYSDCKGLKRCTHTIYQTTLDSAKNHFGKSKFCGFCKYR